MSEFTEAPASATVKVKSPAGYEWMITSRADTSKELLDRLPLLERWLIDHDWQPAGYNSKPANGAGGNGNGAAPLCPTHGQPMKPSQHGGYFCPVKVAENDGTGRAVYCKQKVK